MKGNVGRIKNVGNKLWLKAIQNSFRWLQQNADGIKIGSNKL